MDKDGRFADDVANPQGILGAMEQYGLDITRVERLKKGHNNEHFVVQADGRPYVLRRYRQSSWGAGRRVRTTQSIQYEHDVLEHAAGRGIPCVPALRNRGGDTISHQDGGLYALFEFRDGQTYVKDASAGVEAARLLAKFHRAMADFGPRQRPHRGYRPRLGDWFGECESLGQAGEILEWATTLQGQTDTQRYIGEHAAVMQDALRILHEEVPGWLYADRQPVVNHGDYYYANLGWSGGQIVTVYDFDECVLDHPMLDVSLLAFMYASGGKPQMDFDVVAPIIAAYRQGNELSPPEVSLLPYFVAAHMLHIAIAIAGVVRARPDGDKRWLLGVHVELVGYLMGNRRELSQRLGQL